MCVLLKLRRSAFVRFTFILFFLGLFQLNSAAAKLLKGRHRSRSESTEFCHQTGSGAKDKTTDASNWAAHYGVPQVLAKTPVINALPHSSQRKQPTGERSSSFQTPSDSYRPQGHPQRLSAPSGLPRTYTYPFGVSSRQINRHSASRRHQSQVSHLLLS